MTFESSHHRSLRCLLLIALSPLSCTPHSLSLTPQSLPHTSLLIWPPSLPTSTIEWRAVVGNYGIPKDYHLLPIKLLSDGLKTRLVFCEISLQTPHLLLFDEPTNAADMEVRMLSIRLLFSHYFSSPTSPNISPSFFHPLAFSCPLFSLIFSLSSSSICRPPTKCLSFSSVDDRQYGGSYQAI